MPPRLSCWAIAPMCLLSLAARAADPQSLSSFVPVETQDALVVPEGKLEFQGYGPGATFQQLTATEWQISSADGSIHDTIVLIGAPALDASDWHFT